MRAPKLADESLSMVGGYDKARAISERSLAPPLYQTISFPLESAEVARRVFDQEDPYTDYIYTRRHNPTTSIFEERMALLEGGEAGLATSSGMSAIFCVASYLLENGAEAVISNRVYTRVFELFTKTLSKFGVTVRVVNDPTDLSEWEQTVSKETQLLYVETPSNPGLVISDIKALSEIAQSYNVPLIVDNTLATPVSQKPLGLGATAVIESVSKYVTGNGTTLGGALITRKDWVEEIRKTEYLQYGMAPSPFNSWLCLLGLETLKLRMIQHSENATRVAAYLENHPKVGTVNFPGLETHPQHELAKKQMNGLYGGLLSFSLKDERMEKAFDLLNALRTITHAIHEGSSRSVICHPPSTNFADLTDEEMEKAEIPKSLIRLSVGIENGDDLLNDLEQALNQV
ncbi:MAG: aminotransferase class I/II-fold pyridoxal phosphate-dependent enzyme [Proteobacteria bacterium]|nr:aminotransferase class I/II-fold pyridoxal phosphate-dependent enzyme [Pseudomonadota bacterium]NIS70186.1 aminotransferase class I/II-fold pyridoxal phosphate-dependent enzyme [Pseudomonadota bacterium]